jgi:hypothetical protein
VENRNHPIIEKYTQLTTAYEKQVGPLNVTARAILLNKAMQDRLAELQAIVEANRILKSSPRTFLDQPY